MALLFLLAKCLLTLSLLAICIVFHRLVLHSLAHIPGPRLAASSNIWHAYHVRNGLMLPLAKRLHQRYGPVVRVGPNEVCCDSKEAFLKIYNASSAFSKSSFYGGASMNTADTIYVSANATTVALALNRPRITTSLGIGFPDTLDLLGEFHMPRYKLQRRLIGPLYQTHSLLAHERAIDLVLVRAIAQIETLHGAEVDLKQWMHIITVECLTAVVISWSPGFIRDKTDHGSGSHAYLGWRRKSVLGLFPWAEVLDSYSRTLGRLFAKIWGLTFKTPVGFKALFPLIAQKTRRRVNAALRPHPPRDDRSDLAAELIALHKQKPELTKDYLQRMIMTNFGAGHETTTSALTSALTMIGSHPAVQERVSSEIKPFGTGTAIPYKIAASDELEYTRAAIREAQRLYPAIGMSLSRTVPAGGVHIDGHYLPPGSIVGCNPVALHRNKAIFGDDAEDYNPDRWLREPPVRRDMERCNLIFGGGARTCPGRNLAELILYKVVSTLLGHFEVRITQRPADDEVCYYFMAMLTGVKARFVKRNDAGDGRGKMQYD